MQESVSTTTIPLTNQESEWRALFSFHFGSLDPSEVKAVRAIGRFKTARHMWTPIITLLCTMTLSTLNLVQSDLFNQYWPLRCISFLSILLAVRVTSQSDRWIIYMVEVRGDFGRLRSEPFSSKEMKQAKQLEQRIREVVRAHKAAETEPTAV